MAGAGGSGGGEAGGAPVTALRHRVRLGSVGAVGLALLAILVAAGALAPWIVPYDPEVTTGDPFEPPSRAHLLGTNDVGQDLLSELIYGVRISLTLGFLAAVVAISLRPVSGVGGGCFG